MWFCLDILHGWRILSSSLHGLEASLFCSHQDDKGCWHFDWDHVTMHGMCLRQRDNNSRSLECCFVAVDGICCRRMSVGGTAEVQMRDPCSLTFVPLIHCQLVKPFTCLSHRVILCWNCSSRWGKIQTAKPHNPHRTETSRTVPNSKQIIWWPNPDRNQIFCACNEIEPSRILTFGRTLTKPNPRNNGSFPSLV